MSDGQCEKVVTLLKLGQRTADLIAPGKPVLFELKFINSASSLYLPVIAKAQAIGLQVET